jgi:hypothetical protein
VAVRPKLGFCNCSDGVTDDAEVDGATDLWLLSDTYAPVSPGHSIKVAEWNGRTRQYTLSSSSRYRSAAGVALSAGCDLISITLGSTDTIDDQHLQGVLGQIGSPETSNWLRQSVGTR